MQERRYQKLIAWQEAHKLCVRIYAVVASFPKHETFGLTSQIQRSSSSVPTNIAEGNGQRTKKMMIKYFNIALGSLEELHYQILLAKDLKYITEETCGELHKQVQRVGYLLTRLRGSLL